MILAHTLIHKGLAHRHFQDYSTEWFPTGNFMVLGDKLILTKNPDITHEIKETLKDSTTKNFGTKRHINFRRKNLDTLPLPPLLSINIFANGTFMKYSAEWFSLHIFWYCETKKVTEDRDITHKIKETSKGSTTKKFGTESQKKFRRKHLDTLLPSYP